MYTREKTNIFLRLFLRIRILYSPIPCNCFLVNSLYFKAKSIPSSTFEHGKAGSIPAHDTMPPSAPAESAAPAAPPPPAAEEIITAPGGVPAPVEMPAASPAVQQPDPASNGFNFMDEQEVGELTVKEEEACVI
jgi:hypothetical protein